MFKTVKRIIHWCGAFKKNLYIGFVFSFFSGWFAAMPVIWAAFLIGRLVESAGRGEKVSTAWVGKSIGILMLFIFLRFLFDYLRARFQEAISYELIARDRLAVGDALKRVSLGYFQNMNTSTILNSITTGLHTLEGMGIRMIDTARIASNTVVFPVLFCPTKINAFSISSNTTFLIDLKWLIPNLTILMMPTPD